MKKKTVIITAAAVAVLAVAMIPRVLKGRETSVAASLPVVSVEKPEMGSIQLETGLTGTVEPADMVSILIKAGGEVTDVFVKAGDYVQEGQELLHIDTKQVDGARINLDTAAINLQDANTNLQRMTVLYQSGDISQQAFEQVQSAANMAKLQYEGAKLAYDNQVEFSTITAPISGLVESFSPEVRDNVAAGSIACVISGQGTKALSFNVTERVVKGLKPGDPVRVEKNGSEYTGSITEVSSMVDPASGMFKVKASLSGADALATGALAKLYVVSERADQVMIVPTDAVYYEGGKAMVYTLKDNKVSETPVTVGIYDAERSEIQEGLTLEDQVITSWSDELFEGSEVEIYDGGKAASEETDGEAADEEAAGQAAADEAAADETSADGEATNGEGADEAAADEAAADKAAAGTEEETAEAK